MLEARHAFVTGGGSGIGRAIAEALAGAGAEVTIAGRRAEALGEVAAGGPRLYPAVMDATEEPSVEAAVTGAVAARGPVTICVANAGVAEGRALHKTDLALWRRIMAVNLDGAFLTIRACLGTMRGQDWGRVIAVSSIAGLRGLKGGAAYSASKHGVVGLIRALSEDYLGTGLTFNALCPGYVDTPIVAENLARIRDKTGMGEAEALALMTDENRHRRLIAPVEVAAAALWLCGPGSASVNGQTVEIAGGQA